MIATDTSISAIAVLLILSVLLTGPRVLIARWVLRTVLPASRAKALAPSVSFGVGAGLAASVVLPALTGHPELALACALIGTAFLLGALDWRWRWLPLEWTIPLLVAGLFRATVEGRLWEAVIAAGIMSAALLAVQYGFRLLRGRDGLGTGDIILMAGVAAHTGPFAGWQILGFAAMLALAFEVVRAVFRPAQQTGNTTVAFGTYICFIFSAWTFFALLM